MQYKLYTDAGNFRAFKALIAAEYNNVDIQLPDFNLGKIYCTPLSTENIFLTQI